MTAATRAAHWVKADTGRGRAHLLTALGRTPRCGRHLGYGNLTSAHDLDRRCRTCARIAGAS